MKDVSKYQTENKYDNWNAEVQIARQNPPALFPLRSDADRDEGIRDFIAEQEDWIKNLIDDGEIEMADEEKTGLQKFRERPTAESMLEYCLQASWDIESTLPTVAEIYLETGDHPTFSDNAYDSFVLIYSLIEHGLVSHIDRFIGFDT